MRRANGTGTITKLSGTRRRPYIAKYCVGRDDNGARKYAIVGYYATKSEASNALAQFSLNPDPMSVSNITFGEIWELIKAKVFEPLTSATEAVYQNAYKKCAPLHNRPLRSLKTMHFQSVLDGSGTSSKSSKVLMRIVMNKICDYGVQNDIVTKNYAHFAIIAGTEKPKQEIYTDEEINGLFADKGNDAKVLLMLIYSGFRIGEFAKIRKSDVDLDNRVVVGGSKTKAGKDRTVPIHNKVYGFWKEFYDKADDYLFAKDDGRPRSASSWNQYFIKVHKRLGIPFRSPHAARHTCASLMARDGVNPLYIKEILGHATYAFTADRYTHVDSHALVKEINKIK